MFVFGFVGFFKLGTSLSNVKSINILKIKMMNKWLYVITIRIMFLVRKGQNSGGPAGFGFSFGISEIYTLGILSISHNVTYSVYLFIFFSV